MVWVWMWVCVHACFYPLHTSGGLRWGTARPRKQGLAGPEHPGKPPGPQLPLSNPCGKGHEQRTPVVEDRGTTLRPSARHGRKRRRA